MAHERAEAASVVAALKDLFADGADLVRKELQLARAEIAEALSAKIEAGIWMSIAAVLGAIAGLLVIQALVFGIASFGIAIHWACLIVAAILVAVAAGCFAFGRTKMRGSLVPERTLAQIDKDLQALRSD